MKKYLLPQLMLSTMYCVLLRIKSLCDNACYLPLPIGFPPIKIGDFIKQISLFIFFFFIIFSTLAQNDFQLNGAATSIGTDCFELTPEQTNKYGSIWYKQKIDLKADFNINANMYFGTKDAAGADGIVFAFQGVCTNAGSTGQGLGIAGITPSLFVEFDTYQNTGTTNDPVYDHIAIFRDGVNNHGAAQNLSTTVQASATATNIEDGLYHNVKISWIAASKTLAVYFDNVLRTSYTGDVVSTIFGGNQFVYYGFTAATGGSNNFQRVCLVNPPKQNNAVICNGSSTELSVLGAGTGTYSWSPSTGLNQTTGATVTANPTATTTYTVTGAGGACGAITFNMTVTVVPIPTPSLNTTVAVCEGSTKTYTTALHAGSTYAWSVSGAASYTSSANTVTVVAGSGNYTIGVIETEGIKGCSNISGTGASTSTIIVNPKPVITAAGGIYCVGATGLSLNASGAGIGGTYVWSPASNLSSNIVSNPVATPAISTTYTLTGTDVNGCANVASVLVNAYPRPMITTANASMCMGGAGAKLSSAGAGVGGVYSWSPSANLSSATIFNPVAKPSTTTTYTVTGTDANGCTNMATATVTVNPVPIITATGGSFCGNSGKSVMLSSSGAGVGGAYTWNPVLHLSASNIANPIATLTASAVFTVTGTNTFGCSGSATASITVNPLPTVSATASAVKLCAGAAVTLRGTGAVTYTWDNGAVDGVSFVPNSTKHYKVIGTDVNGCENTASVQVFVNPSPTVSIMTKHTDICLGDSASLMAAGAVTYLWDNAVVNGKSFSPTATKTYTVTGTDSNGCKTVNHVLLKVNPLPNITVKASSAAICLGDQVKLNGVGARDYVWNNGISDGILFRPLATQTFTVVGTDVNGCTGTAQASVKVNALPNVTATAIDEEICIGESATVSAKGALTYNWSDGIINNQAFVPGLTKTYTVTGTDANSCHQTDSVRVLVHARPVVTASASFNAVCIGNSIVLNGGGASSYTWNNGANNGLAFNPTVNKMYTVTGKDLHGCSNSASLYITVYDLPTVVAHASKSSVCIGEKVVLTGTGAVTYLWNNGVINAVAFAPTASQTYTLTGTDVHGCVNTAQVNMVVNPLPSLPLTRDLSICKNDPSPDLTSYVTGSNLRWYDDFNAGNQIQNPSVTTATSGTRSVYVSQTDANACESSRARITIKVNEYPTAKITTTALSYCKGQQDGVLLTATAEDMSLVFDWYKDGFLKSSASGVNTFSHALAGIWTVKVKSGMSGCDALSPAVTVIENLPPVAEITSLGQSLTYCQYNPQGTLLSAKDAGNEVTYEWYKNELSQSAADKHNTYLNAYAGNWTVKVVNTQTSCFGIAEAVVVKEKAAPVASISNTGSNNAYCEGDKGITLSAQSIAGASYEWLYGGNKVGTGLTFANAQKGFWLLKVTVEGCADTSNAFQVLEKPLPLAAFSADFSSYCANAAGVNFTATNAGAGATYEWFWNAVVQGTPSSNLVLTHAMAGDWQLKTSLNGCAALSFVKTITQDTLPNAQITNVGNELQYCQYTNGVTLKAKDQGVGSKYEWYKDQVLVSTTTTPILPNATKGNWAMKVSHQCAAMTPSLIPVTEKLLPHAAITALQSSYCEGGIGVVLTAKAVAGATYQWFMNGRSLGDNTIHNVYSNALAGSYSVKVTADGCDSLSTLTLIKVNELPKALVSGVKNICQTGGTMANLSIDFSGTSPWTYTYQYPDGKIEIATSTIAQATISGAKEGIYKVLSVKDANCEGTSEGFGRVQYIAAPVIANVTRTCLPSASAFVVKFDIRNGEASTYAVKGWTGQLLGNVWTSDSINENTTAILTITDANQCNPLVQSFSKSCSCAADGFMSGGGEICNDKVSKAQIEIALQGQAPWEIAYSVDNGSLIKVSGILASPFVVSTSQNSTFLLQQTRDAHCLGSSNGSAKVVYLPSPSAVITGQSSVCKGQDLAHLQINFTGTAPWSFEVNTPKGNETVTNVVNNPFDYTPSAIGEYTLVKANDAHCAAPTAGLVGLAKVEAYIQPDTSRLKVYCDNSDHYYIEMALVNGDANTYKVDGVFGTFTNQVWTSTLIPSGIYTTLTVSDHKTCTPMVISGITKTCICPAKATLTGRKIYCDDSLKASVHIALEGTAPWDISYRLNGGTLVQTRSIDNTLVVNHIDKTSGFYLVSVKDAKCYGTTSGEGLVVVNRLPTSNLSGGGLVCENSPAHMLYMNFTGTPPYQFIYTDGKNRFAEVSNDGLFQIQNPADGDYAIIGVTDANGCVASQMRGEAHVEVRKFSAIHLAGDTSICQGAEVPISVKFDSQAQAPYTLTYDGGNGFEVINHITTNPYQITIHPKQNTFVTLIEAKDKFACVKKIFEDSVKVQVSPIPYLKIINTAPTICSGLNTEIRLVSTTIGTENSTKFQWKASSTSKIAGLISAAEGDTIRQTLVNNGTSLASVIYTVLPYTTTAQQLACYGDPAKTTVSVRRATLPNLGPDTKDVCIGSVLHLQAGDFVGGDFTWLVNDSLLPQTNGDMAYTVTSGRSIVMVNYVDICNTPHADTLLIDAKMPVSVSFTSTDTCVGMSTQFTPVALQSEASIDTWTWNYLNVGTMHQTTDNNPVEQHSFANAGKQKVLLEGYSKGCKLGDTTMLLTISNCDFIIPNTFTPNADGKNDVWEIKGIERYANANIVIMNRWGVIIHEIPGSHLPWNGNNDKGEAVEAGVYYYIITLNKVKESSEIIQGHINVLISNND